MGYDEYDSLGCNGQMSIEDFLNVEIPENVFAVSKIFAAAKKQMNLQELKAFTYVLANIKFKNEKNNNKVMLDKKTLATIVGVNSDVDHLSVDLKRSIGELPKHSFIEIDAKDLDFYESGVVVTNIRMYKNNACITINPEYMGLFEQLDKDYITMWSGDIFRMKSERSIAFYESLRLNSDTRVENHKGYGIKALKMLFGIPESGPGSYMREEKNGGFNRTNFEKFVIDPLCEDLAKCKMIQLSVNEDGKYYRKVKNGNRVMGYEFCWTVTDRPGIGTAQEMHETQKAIEKNPEILKVAKDIVQGSNKKAKKSNSFNEGIASDYNMDELEKKILSN